MSSTIPYIGSKISLISNSEIRYEGILYTINTQESTIALQSVKTFGTEGRKIPEIPPSSEIYDFIIFRGTDIKDLTVLEGAQSSSPMFSDPAIMSMNQRPSGGGPGKDGSKGGGKPAQPKGGAASHDKGWGQSHGWGQSSKGGSEERGWGGGWGGGWGRSDGYSKGGDGYSKGGGKWDDGGKGRGGFVGGTYAMKGNEKGKESSKGGKGKGGKDDGKGKGKGKDGKGDGKSYGKGDGKSYGKGDRGGRPKGGSKGAAASGVPVGELLPEENSDVKKEYAEEFDVSGANTKFTKVTETEETMKPLTGYNKASSFFDNISCEATDRAAETERPKVDREKARQYDRDTFGDTRRPPRLAGVRRGKGKGSGKGS